MFCFWHDVKRQAVPIGVLQMHFVIDYVEHFHAVGLVLHHWPADIILCSYMAP